MRICRLSFSHAASADYLSYLVRVNHLHGFICAKRNNEKKKRQDSEKVPILHSHERVVRLPSVKMRFWASKADIPFGYAIVGKRLSELVSANDFPK